MTTEQKQLFRDYLVDNCGLRDPKVELIVKHVDHYFSPSPLPSCQVLREALEKIANPINFMQAELKEGETINGQMAIQLSNDAAYLKSIAITALAAPSDDGWVSVEDRLPDRNDRFLIALDSDGQLQYTIDRYVGNGMWKVNDLMPVKVMFWMKLPPLPAPPHSVNKVKG